MAQRTQGVVLLSDDEAGLPQLQALFRRFLPHVHLSVADRVEQALSRSPDAMVLAPPPATLDDAGLSALRAAAPGLPFVVLTSDDDHELRAAAARCASADVLRQPVDGLELVSRMGLALELKAQRDKLVALSERHQRDLERAHLDVLWRLGRAAEHRDKDTGHHVFRVGLYARLLAETMGLSASTVRQIFLTAPLHDIGKIGIPDRILLKPGRLDADEWTIMKGHATLGAEILRQGRAEGDGRTEGMLDDDLRETAAEVALTHHERWDGSGYPAGLRGEDIPLAGRIVALADVFDAISSDRPYKPAFADERVAAILREGAGAHFDPAVYSAYLRARSDFQEVRESWASAHGAFKAALAAPAVDEGALWS